MSPSDDDQYEMIRRSQLDDATIERLLAGHPVAGQEMLVSFVEDTQLATSETGPRPSSALAAFIAEERSADAVSSEAAFDVPLAATSAGRPARRKNMLEIALGKLAGLGLAAKVAAATGALALSGSAAAFSGALPDVAQDRVADAVEGAGIDIPGGADDVRQDADRRQDGEQDVTEVEDEVVETETPSEADFGTSVADGATSGVPQEDGAQFGSDVSSDARETFQPSDTPTAEANPGTEAREGAQPEETPTADSNPGTEYREGADAPEETPTADSNPGTEYREGADAPEETPTADSNPGTTRRP